MEKERNLFPKETSSLLLFKEIVSETLSEWKSVYHFSLSFSIPQFSSSTQFLWKTWSSAVKDFVGRRTWGFWTSFWQFADNCLPQTRCSSLSLWTDFMFALSWTFTLWFCDFCSSLFFPSSPLEKETPVWISWCGQPKPLRFGTNSKEFAERWTKTKEKWQWVRISLDPYFWSHLS